MFMGVYFESKWKLRKVLQVLRGALLNLIGTAELIEKEL